MPLPPDVARDVQWLAEGVGLLAPAGGQPGPCSLVLTADEDVVLVDAGLPPEQRQALRESVTVCLLTHCHVSHARGAGDFKAVWAPRDEARALHSLDEYLSVYGVARRDRELVAAAAQKAGYEPVAVKRRIQPGSLLRLGEHEWEVVAAPGHSQGMLALHDPRRHIVFAADLDGDGPPWYGWPSSDPTDLERTLLTLAEIPTAIYATSHGAPKKRGIKPMLRGMAEQIRERDRQLLAALDHPRTLDELAELGMFLGRTKDLMQRYHERVMVEKHLSRMLEKDHAHARQDGRFQRIS